ncbi:coiled-coil domain-containing protein 71 [Sceloporus undulatus]|uniref:coiled-coil domain-containing protein 71 n=1 Tax=Sceloporus undulatus TaxID=8520 RepID=UPI001C4C213C|nr:coiled-coil domain-containing protein 71 [Sceloporus undulatus]XP_042306843.1 coiled-coil domain-containing protein 71 [Sceloporus undulatus]XP_042306844.1 coiled-coil domain-containing protein 71 [Sceloporus undulatus]XP_042306845.1 coiled-coil domain-containing protein 71 [Sceloporus undulatus]XP_042306846.1 coiled-coil domain-containing protein 71 [Sceloporus undulatus]XP_042306847.1 coiled-coil domain-containing protein 71 [Sceloporus undulatus]XP_042306848.1 coiled-coil domain-contain
MNVEVDNVEEKAVHSWSRIASAGQKALEEALRVFNPMSKDLSDTETQLVAFLQGLREEGYQPTILRSKDVYGYSSCTAKMPSQTKGSAQDTSKTAASILESAKTPVRNMTTMAKVSGPLSGITLSSSKESAKPLSKSSNSTNLLLNSLKRTRSGTSKDSAVGFPASMYPGVYPAMRLSVVLEALVPLKATASCLESKCKQGHLGISPSDLKLLKASSASRQSATLKATKISPSQLDPKDYRHIIKKVPDSAALTVSLMKGPKGGVLRESNACKASGILNGRLSGSTSQSCSSGTARPKEPLVDKTERRGGGSHQETVGQKRKRVEERKELSCRNPESSSVPSPSQVELTSKTLNLLKFQAIKVNSSSDDELRRRAQKILRVNLSPVIRIEPLPHSHSVA